MSPIQTTPSLLGLLLEELTTILTEWGEKPFRSKQIWQWVYHHGVTSFKDMKNIPAPLQQKLADNYSITRPTITKDLKSTDSTRKWLLALVDNNEIETVHIPEAGRGSLCISSQVGCTLTCKFCHTGTQRLVRNLSTAEIVSQLMLARDHLDDWKRDNEKKQTTNIVLMGMGEPLYNYDAVVKALKIFTDPAGLNLSKRKVTLSTSGVVPLIDQLGKDIGIHLAVSLHATSDEVRNELVPLNKKYPLKDLLAACKRYNTESNPRKITFEYVMLKDVNDSDEDANTLLKLLAPIRAKVNLIPFNPWPGSHYECSSPQRIKQFSLILQEGGLSAPVRTPRGQDILAACGQLKSASEKQRKSKKIS